MTVETLPLDQLDGRKIRVSWHKTSADENLEHEGTVIAASIKGLLIKPRGAMLAELIAAEEIISIDLLTDPGTKLLNRKLKTVRVGDARQHLADRHGLSMEAAETLDDAAAFHMHNQIDHSGLSHFHEDKNNSGRVKAIQEAEVSEEE